MSTETHVFFRGKLPSKAALSRAMKELGFPFSIKPATGSLEQQSGFMPMLLRREETGVELDVYGDHAAVEELADAGVDPGFERRASFRWGGDLQEALAGMCAAAALARLVNGVVFDEGENRVLTVGEAIAAARHNLETLPKAEPTKRPGTRPTDIKRYLEPLLKQRDDLALIGRILIIRPVRHLLRGVLLDRTSDKYTFRVWRYIDPLYGGGEGVGYGDDIRSRLCPVWQPYFEPLLLDTIRDILDDVGRVRTFGDLARRLDGERSHGIRVMALVLSGERERAKEYVNEVERSNSDVGYWHHWAESQRAFIERDSQSICATLHAQESETAMTLKLGDIWEPAPFPVEVPEASRAACDEPPFATTPWIARPPGLVQEVPEHIGEIRFAHDALLRTDRIILVVPLTRDDAERRHRTRQDYVLATRLAGGNLLVLHHTTRWSPHDPEQPRNPDYVPNRYFCLEVYGSLGRLQSLVDEDMHQPGIVRLRKVQLYDRVKGSSSWLAYNDVRAMKKTIYDHRDHPCGCEMRPMTASDVALVQFPEPRFGGFNDLWRRISTYLENEGFGSFR